MKSASKNSPYTVLTANDAAHVVKDSPTGITAYIVYKEYQSEETLLSSSDPETIVMERTREDGRTVMSICTPDLGITEKGYTTSQSSQPVIKTVCLNGTMNLIEANDNVMLRHEGGKTVIEAICLHGQPVEFILSR